MQELWSHPEAPGKPFWNAEFLHLVNVLPNSLTLLPARSVSKPLNANDQVIKQLAEFTWAILSLDNHLAGIRGMLIFLPLAESACWGWHCSAKLTSGFHGVRSQFSFVMAVRGMWRRGAHVPRFQKKLRLWGDFTWQHLPWGRQ